MTPDEYKKLHGEKWGKFASTPAGQGLLRLIEDQHPVRKLPKGEQNLGLLTNGSVALLNNAGGYEELADLIRTLADPATEPAAEPPDDFASDEVTGKVLK